MPRIAGADPSRQGLFQLPCAPLCRGLPAACSVANSLCPGQDKRTMRETEVQIANSG
jgi:hypothetical protein